MKTALVVLISYVPLSLFRGWVISLLWGWYVSDYFGLAALTIVEAVGLGILVSVFTARRDPDDDDSDRSMWLNLAYAATFPALALTFGWAWSFVR